MADTARSMLTPPQLARRWGVSPEKIRTWIRSGELRAINAATTLSGRPRYRIESTEVHAIELRRAATACQISPRRRLRSKQQTDSQTIHFF